MRIFYFLGFFLFLSALHAQKHDYIWLFSDVEDGSLPGGEASRLDFSRRPPGIMPFQAPIIFDGTSAMISDAEGQLLFYSNGCRIINAAHQLMENGDSLNPGQDFNIWCDTSIYSAYPAGTQSGMILPDPGDDQVYHFFHKKTILVSEPSLAVFTTELFRTTVDLRFNDGLGKVTEKNIPVLSDTLSYGELTAVKHANGRDWWIICAQWHSNEYYTIRLSDGGMDTIFLQTIGKPATGYGGQTVFSPDGRYFARYETQDDLFLFDFDRSTGLLSNFQFIPVEDEEDDLNGAGLAFSPSSRFLYASYQNFIYQFDLQAADVAASRTIVAEWDGFVDFYTTQFRRAQLGPDCKIYVFARAGQYIHLIHEPDVAGPACRVEQRAVELPWDYFRAAPLFPHYRLGPLEDPGEPCSPVTSVQEVVVPGGGDFRILPNPASGQITLEMEEGGLRPEQMILYDATGRAVHTYDGRLLSSQSTLPLPALPSGLYWVQVRTQDQQVFSRSLVIQR